MPPPPPQGRPSTDPRVHARVAHQCPWGSLECLPTTAPACVRLGLGEDPQGLGCPPAQLTRTFLSHPVPPPHPHLGGQELRDLLSLYFLI